ncbi:MAG TPA: GGDEF domain-containing protein [Bryobacteraceae bacterium]|jgi:diguanylate cyclase (GGDEF)-like protein|nr:GGDEF domain-containing protein [Bryobacteraceae bacterium]
MISLRKHIDSYKDPLTESSLSAWRSSLLAMAQSTERAVPGLGKELKEKLAEIEEALSGPVTPDLLEGTKAAVEKELTGWADRAYEFHIDSVRELREMIGLVAQANDSGGQRDENYVQQIGDLNGRLQALVQLESLPQIRRSILESTRDLKACIEKMAQEGKESRRQLLSEVAVYRARLEQSERASRTDPLTQLANRRAFEKDLEGRLGSKDTFCLIMLDLNGFKAINDRYGHLAGDDMLRTFATELKGMFRNTDLVARWGGDEFVAIAGVSLAEAEFRVEHIRRWALGEYKVKAGDRTVAVTVEAAIGAVQWNGSETGLELLARADACVYALKRERGSPASSTRELGRAAAK